jgi:5-methylcytosine-specific restriction endonuclease McrA
MLLKRSTIVLNKNWIPVTQTSVARAICKVFTGAAQVVKETDYSTHDFNSWVRQPVKSDEPCIRTSSMRIPVPKMIVLISYSDVPTRTRNFSRDYVFKRDKFICQYCGAQTKKHEITIDHVKPKCQGGQTTWENCVAACEPCNTAKADQTPEQAGMKLRKKPKRPDEFDLAALQRKVQVLFEEASQN